ncbi:MAG: LPS export ABC transporter periplasmic protein LptC [Treponema sp.]|nr:LPS export ABC transporter periplasmic protein LptC [Treponema sp.]
MKGSVKYLYCVIIILIASSCTFDYGETGNSERLLPDLIMENVEYVRVRSSDPLARFTAERAERYEKQGLMKLQNFTFEQYGERGREVNVAGEGGNASVDIESGDISMTDGVKIEIGSEDIIMKTNQLDWKDEPRLLYTNEYNEVNIYRENGTSFTGIGLLADARNRTWEFSGIVTGSYINDDDDEDFQLAEGE